MSGQLYTQLHEASAIPTQRKMCWCKTISVAPPWSACLLLSKASASMLLSTALGKVIVKIFFGVGVWFLFFLIF